MALVTARDFKLTPDTSQLTQMLTQAILQGKAQDRQDERLQQKQQAEQVKADLTTTSAQLLRVRDIKDNATQRKEIAKLGQEMIKQGKDPSIYNEALNITNPVEMNLYLTRNALKGDHAKKFIEERIKSTESKDTFDRAAKLRAEVSKTSTDFNKQRGAWGRVKASAEDPSPAGDLALIFNFMKVLDPGSTVREGEFAQVGAAGNLPTQVQRKYDQYVLGNKLTPSQRADVVDRAKRLFTAAEKTNKKDVAKIVSIGKEFKIGKDLILGKDDLTDEERAELEQLRQRFSK